LAIAAVISLTTTAAAAQAAAWELKSVSLPAKGTEGRLWGVSCFSSSVCTAVGDYWNGTKWGASGNEWNGTAWSVASVISNIGEEAGDKNGDLRSVSCFSATRCMAAGAYGHAGAGNTLIESSNKGSWSHVSSPNPTSKGTNPDLYGISCTSLEFCLTAGLFKNKENKGGIIAEEWEGTSWNLLAPPENPGNRGAGHLASISCPEEGWCMGAGGWDREEEGHIVHQSASESWNRATNTWATIEAPQWPAEVGDFHGISCTSPTFCMAVGQWREKLNEGAYHALADVWNGSVWKVVLVSGGPEGATESWLLGVSCRSAEECEVVGGAKNKSGVQVTLAYRWIGEKWQFQTTPNPAEAISSDMEAVSCTGSEACMAVGSYATKASALQPLTEVLK
jgi:hypothetical protein